jgi:Helix-turn-helix domain
MMTELMVEVTDRRVLGVEAAAAYLDTSPRTIHRLIARGVLRPINIPTLKRVLIDRCDLDRLIEGAKFTDKGTEDAMPLAAVGAGDHGQG